MNKRILSLLFAITLPFLACTAQRRADSLYIANALLDMAESFDWGGDAAEGLLLEGFLDDGDGFYLLPFIDDNGQEIAMCYALISGDFFVIACQLSYKITKEVLTNRYGRQDAYEGSAPFWKKTGYRVYAMKDGFLDLVRRKEEVPLH